MGCAKSKQSFIFEERLEMDKYMFLSQVGVAQRCIWIQSAVTHTSLWTLIPSLVVCPFVSKWMHSIHYILSTWLFGFYFNLLL